MTDRILNQLVKLNIIDGEEEEIYRFGLEGIFLKLVHYSSYFVIAAFFHELIRFLVFFSAFLLLRKSAGGYHAKTKGGCYVSSCLTVLCVVICFKVSGGWNCGILTGGFLMMSADGIILALAPLGNRNRTLDQEELLVFKKRSHAFLVIENALAIAAVLMGGKKYVVPVLMAVMCEAVLLLLEKMREGKDEDEQKINAQGN